MFICQCLRGRELGRPHLHAPGPSAMLTALLNICINGPRSGLEPAAPPPPQPQAPSHCCRPTHYTPGTSFCLHRKPEAEAGWQAGRAQPRVVSHCVDPVLCALATITELPDRDKDAQNEGREGPPGRLVVLGIGGVKGSPWTNPAGQPWPSQAPPHTSVPCWLTGPSRPHMDSVATGTRPPTATPPLQVIRVLGRDWGLGRRGGRLGPLEQTPTGPS